MTRSAFDEMDNILLIQGDGQDAKSVRDALANSSDRAFRVEWVKSCALGLERLAAQPVHDRDGPNAISAIWVDLMLPDLAGLRSVDRLVTAAPQIPIIVLCSTQDELVAKEAIQRGAQDYLLKINRCEQGYKAIDWKVDVSDCFPGFVERLPEVK